ncbi:ATP-binding cassette domain-containing protein [Phocaeicola plebeius]|jgi:cell division transport system ATP-binding protein|uniref:cell division ATP-binding protein FtsE n=1 Tax=Phocaeicola plebeius TaxID=310297 RepID=UPI00241DBD03|nr:ATP-binding cassette domain-containing protein [Phocaeicola plebeius]
MEEQPLISYQHVNVSLQGQEILSDVNLELRKGEFVYLIGKVGSGKSTLLKTIYGEVKIDDGEAWVLGNAMRSLKQKDLPTLRRKLGIVFQDFQLLTDRTVHENLKFVLKATGWKSRTEIERRIGEVLQQVGMENKGYKMPNELSGGEQQRIVIARAILNKPEIILADEPTGNLDVDTGRRIVELLQDICRQGSAILMTTHNLNLLSEYPGKVYKCEHHRLTETTNS